MCAYQITIRDDYSAASSTPLHLPEARLIAAIQHVLDRHDVDRRSGLTLVVTGDAEVQRLNREFRGVDAPTDILSFPADLPDLIPDAAEAVYDGGTFEDEFEDAFEGEADFEDEAEPAPITAYLGDLIVAYPYTQRHAEEGGHPVEDELVLLAVHGTLHLLGYDHDNAENQQEMWDEQAAALAALGISIQVPLYRFDEDRDDQPDQSTGSEDQRHVE